MLAFLNQTLTIVFFLMLASFAWFAIGASGAALGFPLGFNTWLKLWTPVFQPLLGIFMLGAILSGVGGWWQQRQPPSEQRD
ncbi:MAG: hypothetical protein AAFX40_14965 [Cyanobacteria bacterium J06639_1]